MWYILSVPCVCSLLGTLAKLWTTAVRFILSFSSAKNNSAHVGRFYRVGFLLLSIKSQMFLKAVEINGHFTWRPMYIFYYVITNITMVAFLAKVTSVCVVAMAALIPWLLMLPWFSCYFCCQDCQCSLLATVNVKSSEVFHPAPGLLNTSWSLTSETCQTRKAKAFYLRSCVTVPCTSWIINKIWWDLTWDLLYLVSHFDILINYRSSAQRVIIFLLFIL